MYFKLNFIMLMKTNKKNSIISDVQFNFKKINSNKSFYLSFYISINILRLLLAQGIYIFLKVSEKLLLLNSNILFFVINEIATYYNYYVTKLKLIFFFIIYAFVIILYYETFLYPT